jgi:putative hydrolase of the HAD superfamily
VPVRAVILDFYGTLAEGDGAAGRWDDLVAAAGYRLDPAARDRFWNDGIDGVTHDEHSRSRDHYVAWQHARIRALLDASGVPPATCDGLARRMHESLALSRLVAYDEVGEVLAALRARGLALAICSNWDWDLHEAIARAGVDGACDVVVSSAWVGARKPHPRIYARTLEQLGVDPADAVFVGDTWTCDVEGPRAVGLRPVYVRRPHLGPDPTAPADVELRGVERVTDLRGVLGVL